MIRIEGLEFRYSGSEFRLVLPELSVEKGSSVAIIGPSGCGKTTLLRLISGILLPHAGSVVTNGVEVSSRSGPERRDFRLRSIGLVFQEFELLEYLSVLDNVLLPFRIGSALELDADARARAVRLAQRLGLGEKLARHPAHLSQGERQRAAVCRALVTRPVLLLADEPTGNLDPTNKGRVLDGLIAAAAEEGATLVCVTHDHGLLDRFDRVLDFEELNAATPREAPLP